jgi:hypothetical protein
VYCSLLLCILVISLFDFHSSWFEPRYAHPSTLFSSVGNTTTTQPEGLAASIGAIVPTAIADKLEIMGAVVNGTATSLMNGLREMRVLESTGGGFFRSLLRREWKINCFDIAIRL